MSLKESVINESMKMKGNRQDDQHAVSDWKTKIRNILLRELIAKEQMSLKVAIGKDNLRNTPKFWSIRRKRSTMFISYKCLLLIFRDKSWEEKVPIRPVLDFPNFEFDRK